MNASVAASLKQVTKSYARGSDKVTPVRDLSLELPAGSMTVLTGPSGSGKTTVLNLLAGFDVPDEGEVWLGDLEVGRTSPSNLDRLRSKHLGFIFQQFNLIQGLSARENVGLALVAGGVPGPERERRAAEQLNRFGLEGLEHRRPSHLSGGQQQRVGIARALVGKPGVVLADEPTAALDRENATSILKILRDLATQDGVAVLISTHDSRCLDVADQVIVLDQERAA